MKKLILCLLFGGFLHIASSQKVYFVYLQAETARPFFVSMNEKPYNSTTAGYLILANLRDTTYNLTIGFPENKIPMQRFSITIHKKDHGYLLKDFQEKGWGLYDLQNSAVLMSATPVFEDNSKKEEQNSSAFTAILSKAANDPSLKEKTEIVLQDGVKKEERILNNISESSEKNNNVSPDSIKSTSSKVNETTVQSNVGNKCIEVIAQNDFDLLCQRIAVDKSDSSKISQAINPLSLKCYTTEQIRKLCSYLLKDEVRYKFFKAAYPYVSDSSNFISLQSELKDVFYKNKLGEMLHSFD